MMNEQCGTSGHMCKRFSWSAVFVGAIVGIGLSFLLNLFSVAIGLSLVSMKEGAMTLAVGGLLGMLIGTIVSAFMAGMTAGYLGKPYCGGRNLGVLYGFTAWCVALILTAILMTNIGRYVNSYSNFMANPTMVVVMNKPGTSDTAPAVESVKTTKPAANSKMTAETTTQVAGQPIDKALAFGSMLIFFMFFVGALSSAIGGYCAMSCCREDR